MIHKKLDSTPMQYYISENRHEETVMFFHAAFADHTQFSKQIEEFYQMNIRFLKKSFMYLNGLKGMVNTHVTNRCYPLLIGCGDHDIPMELKAVEMWHELEPNSEVIIFKDAGHLVNMDAPNAFNKILIEFIIGAKM